MKVWPEELNRYSRLFENELINDILPFWMNHGIDREHHTFYGAANLTGNPDPAVPLSCVLCARILWTFSAVALKYPNPEYEETAHLAYRVLTSGFEDKIYGGYFMEVAYDGEPAIEIKHTYSQAFVIYSLCKYFELTKQPEVMRRITSFFDLLERKAKDLEHDGYLEAFTRDWQLCGENRMADNNEPKSMNTHLHVLEAYASLFREWKSPLVEIRLRELLLLFLDRIIRPDGHLGIFFNHGLLEVESSKGICSFGHDIEASWLLSEAAHILGDAEIIQKTEAVSLKMAKAVQNEGLDHDGGLFLESYRSGSHIRTNKHWWIQAENLVGFMNAFSLTGDPVYWEIVKKAWSFIDNFVIDHENGEWFTKVNRAGIPFLEEPADDPSPYYLNNRKIDPWKCPYHNGRAMLEMMRLTGQIKRSQASR
jgi:cellobiose epimerase